MTRESMRVLIVERASPSPDVGGPNVAGISSAYRKPHTCWQHHASLTGGVSHSEPASVAVYLLSRLPLAAISIDWLSLRFAGPRAAWA